MTIIDAQKVVVGFEQAILEKIEVIVRNIFPAENTKFLNEKIRAFRSLAPEISKNIKPFEKDALGKLANEIKDLMELGLKDEARNALQHALIGQGVDAKIFEPKPEQK